MTWSEPVRGAPSAPCGRFEGAGAASTTAVALASPTTISLPAGRPPCAAVKCTRRTATLPWAAGAVPLRLPVLWASTYSVPQSLSGIVPGVEGTSCPSTRNPCTTEPATSAPAERVLAPALALAVTCAARTSPPNTESAIVSAVACVTATGPLWAVVAAPGLPDGHDRAVVRIRERLHLGRRRGRPVELAERHLGLIRNRDPDDRRLRLGLRATRWRGRRSETRGGEERGADDGGCDTDRAARHHGDSE